LTLQVQPGLVVPQGGLVLPWPYSGEPGEATINGEPAQWINGELRITQVPARVDVQIPASVRRAERKAP